MKRKGSDLEEVLANASHYVKEFGRHDAYAGGEQVRAPLDDVFELERTGRRRRRRSTLDDDDDARRRLTIDTRRRRRATRRCDR